MLVARLGRRRLAVWCLVAILAGAGAAMAASLHRDAPPDRAARFVPAGALAYVHLATGEDGDQYRRGGELVRSLPALAALRDELLSRLSASGEGFDVARDVRGWLGDEAALALVDRGGGRAGSLLVLETADARAARQFLNRVPGTPLVQRHRGLDVLTFGTSAAVFIRGFMLVGRPETVRRALDASEGPQPSLAGSAGYRELRDSLPDERLAHAYGSAGGLRSLLPTTWASLVDAVGLGPTIASLSLEDGRARAVLRSLPAPGRRRRCAARDGGARLLDSAPPGAMAYVEIAAVACAIEALRAASPAFARTLERLRTRLAEDGVDLRGEVLPLLRGAGALAVRQGRSGPVASLVVDGVERAGATEVLARLQPALLTLLAPEQEGLGEVTSFEPRPAGGVTALAAPVAPGVEPSYALADRRLFVSTAVEGIEAARADGGLEGESGFRSVVGDRSEEASTVIFIDPEQLLALGEQVGLAEDRRFSVVRDDLQKLRSIGVTVSREERHTNAELLIQIP